MGLDVSVGLLADLLKHDEEGASWLREDLEKLNEVLLKGGLARHDEPEKAPLLAISLGSYDTLHELRRVAACWQYAGSLPGRQHEDRDPDGDALTERYYLSVDDENTGAPPGSFIDASGRRFDHLMVHGDSEGFYIPQRFQSVLVTGDDAYGAVGSSFRLAEECEELARALDIPIDLLRAGGEKVFTRALHALEGRPSLGERVGRMLGRSPRQAAWRRLPLAALVCAQIYRAAQHSIRTGAVIVFH